MVARYGPKFDGSERKVATACKTLVDAAGTAMPFNGRCGYEFWSNVPHPVPSRASYVEAWDRVVFLSKLVFETGCADISARAEWTARTLSAGTHSPKTDNPFMPVSH
jgi:hypothetical protein